MAEARNFFAVGNLGNEKPLELVEKFDQFKRMWYVVLDMSDKLYPHCEIGHQRALSITREALVPPKPKLLSNAVVIFAD